MAGVLRRAPIAPAAPSSGPFWPDTKSLINRQAVTPLVGSFMSARLVDGDLNAVAETWAEDGAVLAANERRDLARVAQFYSVQKNRRETKNAYLEVLKGILYAKALDDPALDDQVRNDLQDDPTSLAPLTVSELARTLGYPRFAQPEENPLRLLAELPLPLFITTCHHDFLEHALANTGTKQPVSEILYWDQVLESIPSIYDTEPDYKPSVNRPLVYHLFGRDAYHESLVLTEDDHLDCLVKLSELRGQVSVSSAQAKARSIPTAVRTPLSTQALLLLGYGVYHWDFRVLFRGLILGMGGSRASNPNVPRGICMQMDPASGNGGLSQHVKEHFERYFDKSHFDVYWGDELQCVTALHTLWRGRN
jgi:hypothetical protein